MKTTDGTVLVCQRCGERLNPKRTVWLEMNSRTGAYYAQDGMVPPEDSQGAFPFGAACAKRAESCQ